MKRPRAKGKRTYLVIAAWFGLKMLQKHCPEWVPPELTAGGIADAMDSAFAFAAGFFRWRANK